MSTQKLPNTKAITWDRVRRNLGRIIKSCVPPVLQGPLGWKTKDASADADDPSGGISDSTDNSSVQFELPVAQPNELWPGFDQTPITMMTRQIRDHLWGMPENELMVLATICRLIQPKLVFEFGTFTGASTLAMACNCPDEANIHTLDLDPGDRKSHRTGLGSDIPFEFEIGQAFLGTPWESKIQIHTNDTRKFDTSSFRNQIDLIFVDADHTYSFVKSDTEKALEMLKPGGVILWHDYRWDEESPECAGVTRWVNEFYRAAGSCHEIAGTRFAIYQDGRLPQEGVAA